MLKYLYLISSLFLASFTWSQATLFSEDFESGAGAWTASGDISPNFWTVDACAGNGTSAPGSTSAYISNGTTNLGCTPGLVYEDAPSGIYSAIYSATIDATCASGIIASFDYIVDGIATEDYGQLVYSTNGGATWTTVGSQLNLSSGWNSTSVNLPALLDGTTFLLGFQFNYNNSSVNGSPLGFDNLIVTGTDNTAPTIICQASKNVYVNAVCEGIAEDVSAFMFSLSDNCTDSASIVLTQNIPAGTILTGGAGSSQLFTITATDESGNSSQCNITLNLVDTVIPASICPIDTTIIVNSSCVGTVEDYTGDVLFSDNCSSFANIIVTQNPPAGTTINGSGIDSTMTIYFEDESGNIGLCYFTATTVDTTLAVIVCPNDTTLYLNSSCSIALPDFTGLTLASDNCVNSALLSISQSPFPGATITSDQIVTMTVSGGDPSTPQSCVFNAFVVDSTTPNISCPVPTNLYLNSNCEAILPDYTSSAIVSDNCASSLVISQSPLAGTTLSGVSSTSITLSVVDAFGNSNSCVLNQATLDTISPVLTCPSNQTVNADANCLGVLGDYTGLVLSSDNCSSTFTYTQSPVASSSITTTTAVTITGTDQYGNNGFCMLNVGIVDNIDPIVTCPSNQSISLDANCEATLPDFQSSIVVVENCSPLGSLIVSQSPSIGSTIFAGPTVVTITVTDTSGNSGTCNFNLTAIDQTAPTVICPGNQSLISSTSCTAILGDYTSLVTYSDNCTATSSLTIQQSPVNGTSISSNTLVTMTITDAASNTSTCQFNSLLIDTIQPSVTCPSAQTVAIVSGCQYSVPDLSSLVTGSDNCSSLSNMIVTQNPPVGSTQNGITTVLVTLTDEQGNNNTCATDLIPDDQSAPTITCPTPAPANAGTSCDLAIAYYGSTALVLDNCSNYTIDQTPAQGTIVPVGTNSITLIVTDAGGNTDQCTFDLQVVENVAPVITCPGNISTCDPLVTFNSPVVTDNCGAMFSQTDNTGLSSGMNFPVGITTLEFTATDSSGNQSMCSFDVEILDYPSSANIVEDTIQLCNANSVVVSADAVTSGNGIWTVSSGQGSFNNEFANQTGVNNIAFGTSVFVWTVSSAACGTISDSVVVVNTQLDLDASTQDTIITCAQTEVLLQANTPLYGVGTWTSSAGAIIDDLNSSNTHAQLTSSGWQYFVWTIENGGCPTTTDTLKVLGNLPPNIYTNDTIVCLEDNQVSLVGQSPVSGITTTWSVILGNAQLETTNGPTTNVYNLELGTTIITYSSSYTGCPSVGDTMIIVTNLCEGFDPVIPTMITPNYDGKNDLFVIANLEKIYPECHVVIFNRWGSVVFESTGYETPWDGTFKGEPLPMGTYYYNIELNDENGTVYKGDISIIH